MRGPFCLTAMKLNRILSTRGVGLAACVLVAGLSGCATVGPDYQAPKPAMPASWQAALPHGGQTANLIDWWKQFNDPTLTELQRTAEADSPSLGEAWANIESARAAVTTARASGLPQLTASASQTRSSSNASTSGTAMVLETTKSGALDASWEIDLFGGIRRSVQAADAKVESKVASWHDARVSLASEVATDYVTYRACQLTLESDHTNAESQRKTADITATSVKAGFSSPADGALAEASSASAAATLTDQQATCDKTVKSLVALTGRPEPELRKLLDSTSAALPTPTGFTVDSLPAKLVEQRPDIVSAERALAAASAKIGVATADLYPSLSLTGSISRSAISVSGSRVVATPWSFGPSLSLPIFDGGQGRAAVASAKADYDLALASYRDTVRTAIKEVETALVNLDSASRREADVQKSADGYRVYVKATETNWRAGGDSLLDLEQARRDAITAEQSLITVRRDRVLYWIALYKAMGGGWQAGSSASAPSTSSLNGTTL